MLVMDASTLILVARIEILDLFLAGLSMPVAIPKAVERECCAVKTTLDALMIQKAINDSRIKVIAVRGRAYVEKLEGDFGLGRGEAEAIALAVTEKAQLLGIDDKNGINACKLLGLSFITAPAILVRTCERRILGKAEALAKLDLLSRFGRYKKSILEDLHARLEACQ